MKKIITYILTLIILFTNINVYAQVETYERNAQNNYGVNKKWDITNKENVIVNVPYVNANTKIYDFADILTDEEEKILYEKITTFINKYNTDLVLLTSDFSYSFDSQNEDYAANFYDFNDFGINFENYSGILFFRNNYEADRYYDIYTFGNAQLYFSNERYDELLDGIYYDISSANYLEGYNKLLDYIFDYYEQGIPKELDNYFIDEDGYLVKNYTVPYLIATLISLTITIIIITVLVKKNKMIKKAYNAKEYINKDSINFKNKQDRFIRKSVTHYTMSDSSSGGGSHSSGGFSGGGHSSGGGRHG